MVFKSVSIKEVIFPYNSVNKIERFMWYETIKMWKSSQPIVMLYVRTEPYKGTNTKPKKKNYKKKNGMEREIAEIKNKEWKRTRRL